MSAATAKLIAPHAKSSQVPPRKGTKSKRQGDASHRNAQLTVRVSPAAFQALDELQRHFGGLSASAIVQLTLLEKARGLGLPVDPPAAGASE